MKTTIDLLENAAALLDGEAMALRLAHTAGPDFNDWTGEEQAKREHDDMKSTSEQLYALAEKMHAESAAAETFRKDAARFVFEHTNHGAMIEIELKAMQGGVKSIDWWRGQIDKYMNAPVVKEGEQA